MKKLTAKSAQQIPVGNVVEVITGGIQFVEAVAPIAKILFDKINEFVKSLNIGKNNPNSPINVRKRIAALEAKDMLQKELNKVIAAEIEALKKK